MAKKEDEFVKEIPRKSENFSEWYTSVILKAELADYSPVRGCMVIRPYGYALWEGVQDGLNRRFKATGHMNAYFPLFIPESFLKKEAEHVEGFAPQVALVTHGGGEDLTEPLVVRPTSEAIICSMYAKWIHSYRDLPVLINQWANVVRWEKSTRLFLRTMEFLWQEGHTAHRTYDEAQEETMRMLGVYRDFVENDLAIPVLWGRKTDKEKFAGADMTYTIEALMPDGQALQAGTSHNLGQNFAKAFDIKFLDSDNAEKFAWQTSWGVSTRILGALIMTHGDDRGLALPPKIAPIQIVIVPIVYKEKEAVIEKARALKTLLEKEFRVRLDDRDEFTPGWKYNDWEMRGVPLRVEVGLKDIEKGQVVMVPRDGSGKVFVPEDAILDEARRILDALQSGYLNKAREYLETHITEASALDELKATLAEKRGFVKAMWCGALECELKVKEETGASSRCVSLEEKREGPCVSCGKHSTETVFFARAY
jgi:prolyl-tRNA synthetase